MVAPGRRDDRHPAGDQVGRQRPQPVRLILRIAVFDRNVLARHISGFAQAAAKAFHQVRALAGRKAVQEPDHRHRRLLRARRERPRRPRAAEQRDELAAFHSITSSARASSVGGISRPNALAVLRLITSSNFVGCITGKSAGLVPFKILPT